MDKGRDWSQRSRLRERMKAEAFRGFFSWTLSFSSVLQGEVQLLQLCLGCVWRFEDGCVCDSFVRGDSRRESDSEADGSHTGARGQFDLFWRRDAQSSFRTAVSGDICGLTR